MEAMFMAMAYPTKKAKIGPKIQQWQEEMNRQFCRRLLPTPSIHIEGTKRLQSRPVSDGQIILEEIQVRIKKRRVNKVLQIYIERYNTGIGMNHADQCKWPECLKTREPIYNARNSLFLCEFHRRRMENYFTKMCAENGVVVIRSYSSGDFEGYTALAELFQHAVHKTSVIHQGRSEEEKLLQDVFLNVSNFLVILSAVIKPNEDLLRSFLPHAMGITLEIVEEYVNQRSIANLVSFMQHFLEYILFFFGIMSSWESIFSESNPYCQIGVGVGGMVGVFCLCLVSTPCAIAAMVTGGLLGGVIGNKLYIDKRRREMLDTSYCKYLIFRHTQQNYQDDAPELPEYLNYLSGSALCDTLLGVILAGKALLILMAL